MFWQFTLVMALRNLAFSFSLQFRPLLVDSPPCPSLHLNLHTPAVEGFISTGDSFWSSLDICRKVFPVLLGKWVKHHLYEKIIMNEIVDIWSSKQHQCTTFCSCLPLFRSKDSFLPNLGIILKPIASWVRNLRRSKEYLGLVEFFWQLDFENCMSQIKCLNRILPFLLWCHLTSQ